NGEFFGGGMWIAPGAELDDGRFQVVVMGDISRTEALAIIKDIYRGRHLGHRKVFRRSARQSAARVTQPGATSLLDLDGEQPGKLPAIWNIHPNGIRLKI